LAGTARAAGGLDGRTLFALIAVLALAWAAISALSTGSGAIHEDMAEAYVWGSHLEWGYYKHPPLWAWIAGAWFRVLPREAWAFSLLCALNSAIGLAGAWRLIGLFAQGDKRLAAFLLLLVTPFYAFNGFVFNANAIFISLWPWTAFAFVRAIETRRFWPAVLFGLLAGADMMAKYYAVLLLAGCLAAAVAHPKAKAYFTSPSPYISVAVAGLVFAPHVVWLFETGFLPFHYLDGESGHGIGYSLGTATKLFLGDIALLGGVIALVLFAARKGLRRMPSRLRRLVADPRLRLMAILTFVPFALTLLFGLIFQLKLSTNWTIGVFPLFPLLLVEIAAPPDLRGLARTAGALGILIAAIALLAAPFAPAFSRAAKDNQPRREAVAAANALWRTRTDRPLRVVGGDETYGDAAGFYSPDRPSVFIRFDPRTSPWIDTRRLPVEGFLALCPAKDVACIAGAARYADSATTWTAINAAHRTPFGTKPAQPFLVAVTPPAPDEPIAPPRP
jgi:4-amino-4-deoxy-L-arabinose transferase-like glycosyltransferase